MNGYHVYVVLHLDHHGLLLQMLPLLIAWRLLWVHHLDSVANLHSDPEFETEEMTALMSGVPQIRVRPRSLPSMAIRKWVKS